MHNPNRDQNENGYRASRKVSIPALRFHQKAKQDYLNSINEVKYEKLSLLKQNSITENFEEISSLS